MDVRPKKQLGQHFLKDKNIALQIVDLLRFDGVGSLVEIGPGMGVLTKHLLERYGESLHAVELDGESVEYLNMNYPALSDRLYLEDFLRIDLSSKFPGNISIIGNFPYNISSQILFKVLDYRNHVTEVVGMFQREVARRISSEPGSKEYGILSVLLGVYYDISYEFTVSEKVFSPPPKVKSGVIRLERNLQKPLPGDEKLFFQIVKMGFNQRRKTLRNSLSSLILPQNRAEKLLDKRPEQLSVGSFLELCEFIESQG